MFPVPVQSDAYLKFLVTELKPFIDSTFSVATDRSNTFIAGSSMGGLISMYAVCEYPAVFGGAACLSTHWPGIFTAENNPIPEAFENREVRDRRLSRLLSGPLLDWASLRQTYMYQAAIDRITNI